MDDQTSWFAKQVRAGLRIAAAMNAASDQATVLREMLVSIVEDLGYRGGAFRMLDPELGTLRLASAYGLSDEYLNKGPIELSQSRLDQRAFAGQMVAIEDVQHSPDILYPEAARREGIASMLLVPLRLSGRTVGTLRIYTAETHPFSEEERAFLGSVANLAARAIANAALYRSFRAVARQVNSTLEVKQVLRNLLRSLIDELNVKAASARLLGPRGQRLHLAASEGLSEAYLGKGEIRVAESPIDAQVISENRPVNLVDLSKESGLQYPEQAQREGVRSVLAVPLNLHGRVIGVLRVYSGQPHRFSAEETALVEAIADLGAIALENARLHESLKEKYEAAREDWSGWYRYLALS